MKTSNSLNTIDDATLILELVRRGYDLSRLRNDETQTHGGEIIKIS